MGIVRTELAPSSSPFSPEALTPAALTPPVLAGSSSVRSMMMTDPSFEGPFAEAACTPSLPVGLSSTKSIIMEDPDPFCFDSPTEAAPTPPAGLSSVKSNSMTFPVGVGLSPIIALGWFIFAVAVGSSCCWTSPRFPNCRALVRLSVEMLIGISLGGAVGAAVGCGLPASALGLALGTRGAVSTDERLWAAVELAIGAADVGG